MGKPLPAGTDQCKRTLDVSSPVDGLLGNKMKNDTAIEAAIWKRAIRIDGGHGGSRQMIKTGSDSRDFLIGPVVEITGLINALGTRHRSAALQTIVVSRTKQRDKRSHRRAGNKTPERCCSRDPKCCRIRDRSHGGTKAEEAVRRSIERGQPYGSPSWQAAVAKRLGLESVFRPRGRPRKEPQNLLSVGRRGNFPAFSNEPGDAATRARRSADPGPGGE